MDRLMEEKVSIAFMCNNIDPSAGGTERVTRYVADSLEHKGYSCFYIYSHRISNPRKYHLWIF